jgi:hypothetical protein
MMRIRFEIWKMRALRRKPKIKNAHYTGREGENDVRVPLKCREKQRWREKLLNLQSFTVSDEVAYKKLTALKTYNWEM